MMRKSKFVILGTALVGVVGIATLFLTCNPIFNKCNAQISPDKVEKVKIAKSLTAQEFSSALSTNEYKLIDIRTYEEYSEGHIKASTQSDFYNTTEFSSYLDSLDKNGKYLIYCRSGNRSSQALRIMQGKGFRNVSDLSGGINSWTKNGYPLEK